MQNVLLILLAVGAIWVIATWWRRRDLRFSTQRRLETSSLTGERTGFGDSGSGVPDRAVARWLFLAGFRAPDASLRFWWQTVLLAIGGALVAVLVEVSGLSAGMRESLAGIPGRVGYLFMPVVLAMPVLLVLGFAAVPTFRVRRARRARAQQVLTDLYPVLELFASLAQAGLAFDGALARILTTLGPDRPLGRELMTFQAEVLSGSQRSRCFRRLAHRIELPQVSSFASALIRAHEVGIGLAVTLRRQADDLRSDLRERALARAQSLPARLVFPLVLCFLPGIFVMSLGPAFFGFLAETAGFGVTR